MQYGTTLSVDVSNVNPCDVGSSGGVVDQIDLHPKIILLDVAQASPGSLRTSQPYIELFGENYGSRGSVLFPDTEMCDIYMSPEKNVVGSDKQDDCSGNNYLNAGIHPIFSVGDPISGSNTIQMDHCAGSMICQPDIKICETNMNFHYLGSSSDMLGMLCCQGSLTALSPSLVCPGDGKVMSSSNNPDPIGSQDFDIITCSHGMMNPSSPVISPDSGDHDICLPPKKDQESRALQSTPVKVCSGSQSVTGDISSFDERRNAQTDNLDSEALSYEPPRFSSLDIPFLSCDLISSGDLQQEYSPFGIRQLMMSSMNCSTPYRPRDSPFRDDSPDVVLKNAAQCFLPTPSILRKRQHELLSPLLECRSKQKSGKDRNCKLGTSIINRNDNSSLEIIFDENGSCRASFSSIQRTLFSPSCCQKKKSDVSAKEKENLGEVLKESKDEHMIWDTCNSGKVSNSTIFQDKMEQEQTNRDGLEKVDADVGSETVQAGILAECSVNDLQLFSSVCDGKINIFADSPGIKRGIESPSAWKSPWFMNPHLRGTRIETDTTFEDIGFFMSPGNGTLDAIGLMRLLSEPTAAAVAEAHQVLACGNPEVPSKKGQHGNDDFLNRRKQFMHKGPEKIVALPPDISDGRALDFSGCGTPGRVPGNKIVGGIGTPESFSSYLMKSCR